MGRTLASELISVRPMGLPTGTLYYLPSTVRTTSDSVNAMGQGILSRYSKKTVNPNFYGTIKVDNLIDDLIE